MAIEQALALPYSPKSAARVARLLGPLAGFMLNDHCRDASRSAITRPSLPSGSGACWPVIAVKNQKWQAFLDSAFPLPLRWVEGQQENDLRLPRPIIDCAEKLRSALATSVDNNDKDRAAKFRLWFCEPTEDWPDLSDLVFPADSAFASLALGYFSLLNNVSPSASVWASVRWDGRPLPVEEVPSKVAAAMRWRADSFYVAAEQSIDTPNAGEQTIVRRLSGKAGTPTIALGNYFVGGLVKPNTADADACFAYHAAIRKADEVLATEYYIRVLCHHIVQNCRGKILRSAGECEKIPSIMVSIVTANIEPVTVISGLLGIKRILLLYTKGDPQWETKAKELKRLINDNWPNCKCEIKDFAYDDHSPEFPRDFIASLRGRIEDYLTGVKDADVVFDIDRGTTMHKLALCKLIRPDNWLTTLTHGLKNGKIEHGTESLKLWQYSDDWTQPFRLHARGTEIGEQEKLF